MVAGLDRPLVIVDVGCRWGFAEQWLQLAEGAHLIGFEPDEQECDRLQECYAEHSNIVITPVALGASPGRQTLYLTSQPACSSLYPPDDFVRLARPALDPDLQLVGELTVEVTTLDQWLLDGGVTAVDFMKIDTQGSELDVLRGSRIALRDIRALEVEVDFNPIYGGQPLFSEVDGYLRRHDFVLWRFRNLSHYGLAEVRSDILMPETTFFDGRPVPVEAQGGQLYWADALYVKRDLAFGPQKGPAALRDAVACLHLGLRGSGPCLHQASVGRAAARSPGGPFRIPVVWAR